jgi:hypothetical protein
MDTTYAVGRNLPVAPTNISYFPIYGTHEPGMRVLSRAVFAPVQNVAVNIGTYIAPPAVTEKIEIAYVEEWKRRRALCARS